MFLEPPQWKTSTTADPFAPSVSVRQVVAHNLSLARKARGMTQDELGAELGRLTGKEWSRATVSAAESGWDSRAQTQRIRHFDVNELAALALVLHVPLSWFFLPPARLPSGEDLPAEEGCIAVASSDFQTIKEVITSDLLLWMALGHSDPTDDDDLMGARLKRAGAAEPAKAASEESAELLREIITRLDNLQRQLDPKERTQP